MKTQLPIKTQFWLTALVFSWLLMGNAKAQVQFIYTSDAHYGITRANFDGATSVPAIVVNGAMISKINSVPLLTLPDDGGIYAGQQVGGIDYLIMTGDIANRQESAGAGIQSATVSWAQFKNDYIDNVTLLTNKGEKTSLLLAPGNHDVSNAIGYYKSMNPKTDSATMVNIYNLMIPAAPRANGNYNYANEKIHYSRNIGGIHFMFVNMWPDTDERIWMEADLQV